MNKKDVLVIGAGISGLLCAKRLQDAGAKVCVLDKGRGYGGRMATRRMAGGRLDHGAQFFTVRDPRFQGFVDDWLAAGIIKEWFRHSAEDSNPKGYPRYCGVNGMTDVGKHLAAELEVHQSSRVTELARDINKWAVTCENGNRFSAPYLVVSAPLPQALSLLDTSGVDYAGEDAEALRRVRYAKGLATLLILDGPSKLPSEGHVRLSKSPLSWIADNQMKGISPQVPAITIHADAEFAEAHWDSPDEVRGPLMIKAAEPWLGSTVVEYKCHRWGFTTPLNSWHETHYTNAAIRLTLAGDGFGGARVEGAAVSGIDAADAVIQNMGKSLRGS